MLPGTEGAQSAFWSPDSRYIAFGFRNQLKKIDRRGGPPQILCEVGKSGWFRGVEPGRDILFGRRGVGGLNRVSAAGGAAIPVTGSGVSGFPSFLPGRAAIPLLPSSPTPGIFVGSLDNKPEDQPTTPVLVSEPPPGTSAASNPGTGYVFFVRDQTLMAQPFDERTLTLAGEPVAIDRVATVNNYSVFSASSNGRLAYRTAPVHVAATHLVHRTGKRLARSAIWAGTNSSCCLPMARGRSIVTSRDGRRRSWVADLKRGTNDRFTSDRTLGGFPVWSPNGGHIAFRPARLYQKPSSGGGDAECCSGSLKHRPAPPVGRRTDKFLLLTLLGQQYAPGHRRADDGRRASVSSFLKTQHNESQASFSPDGHWVAYTSSESGRNEVYVAPSRLLVPVRCIEGAGLPRGGHTPVWRHDGGELIFRSVSGAPMAVDITLTATTFQAGMPRRLFSTPPVPWA